MAAVVAVMVLVKIIMINQMQLQFIFSAGNNHSSILLDTGEVMTVG